MLHDCLSPYCKFFHSSRLDLANKRKDYMDSLFLGAPEVADHVAPSATGELKRKLQRDDKYVDLLLVTSAKLMFMFGWRMHEAHIFYLESLPSIVPNDAETTPPMNKK